ncbi:MAG: hypothetical protein RBR52_15030 [Thiomonas sp.]|uniref:hypothetical protein n=1 Tax=Thiomonas sp. TaxID=2047785 RepID=UPI002A36E8E2|nr:hypothetical protein [Thiomonas sp.]MDY0331790.1 hypothetical protein [Thiomonas sp.]
MNSVERRIVTAWVGADATRSLDEWAQAAGVTRSAYVRSLIEAGGPPPAQINAQGVAELRRIGVMLRNFLRNPPARWSAEQTERFFAALAQIERASSRLMQQ